MLSVKDDCIVASDMAGSVVAVGADVKKFSIGQRVSANFCLDHIAGDITEEGNASALGAGRDGVLTEYRLFPEHVDDFIFRKLMPLTRVFARVSFRFRTI